MYESARLDAGVEEKLNLVDQILDVLRGTGNLDGVQGRIQDMCFVVDEVNVGLGIDREVGCQFAAVELKA